MKKLILIFLFVFIFSSYLFADKFIISFECYPKELQAKFAEYGKKLDLRSEEKTDDSWGFLANEGSSYIIYTYRPCDYVEMKLIMDIVMKVSEEKHKKEE